MAPSRVSGTSGSLLPATAADANSTSAANPHTATGTMTRSMAPGVLRSAHVREHRLAEQTVHGILLARFRFHEARPELIGLCLVAGHVPGPKLRRALGVLHDQLPVHERPKQRIGRAHLADARRITAVAAVSGRKLRGGPFKNLAVLLRDKVVKGSVESRLNLRVAFRGLALGEVAHRIVAFERDASFVGKYQRLGARSVADNKAGPGLICFYHF